MANQFPVDEFDSVTGPGGRHRAKRTATSRLVSFARYAVVTILLASIGVVALSVTSGTSLFDDGSGTGTVTQSQFKAGGLGVTVVDATDRTGLAAKLAGQLFDAGWNVLTATNYNLLPKLSAVKAAPKATASPKPAATPTATATPGPVIGEQTVVYVTTGAAQQAVSDMASMLGKYQVVQANTYGDPITIVLGNDYK